MRKVLMILLVLFICRNAGAQMIQPKGKTVLQVLPYGKVQLLDSRWKQQQDEVKEYYLRIPNDDILKQFRERAGLPTYGAHDMGGWYTQDLWSPFGQFISGLSRMYAATGDERCREKVDAIISGWGACIDSSGYFFATKKNNSQHYTYEKILCGLIDAYTYTDNKDALKYMSVITNWSIKHLSRDKNWAGEWYTLPENLYKAYLITGDKKYYDFANEWEYTDFWNRVVNGNVFDKDHKADHAYSHLNTFSSASMAYMVKGDAHYKDVITKAYTFFNEKECFPTGGFGPNEMLTPQADIRNALYGTDRTFETQCGSWAVFKLSKYLTTITGDGQYGDWVEKMLVNGIGASIPMSADGRVMYYSDYNPREGFKKNVEDPWSCCTGTRIQAIADYAQQLYYSGNHALYVSQYIPSRVNWNGLVLSQQSQFPTAGDIGFLIEKVPSENKPMALNFRKPCWLKEGAMFRLNGKLIVPKLQDGWFTIDRVWHAGDKLQMYMPMDFYMDRVVADFEYPKMLMRGPAALAIRTADDDYPSSLITTPEPWKAFSTVAGEPDAWHYRDMLIRPFYDLKEHQPYVLCLDTSVQHWIGTHNITLSGDWHLFYKLTKDTGATITAKFKGTGFKMTGSYNADAGKFSVMIDGRRLADGDEYAAEHAPYEYKITGLKQGDHTVVITTLEETNKNSKGRVVNYGVLEKID